MGWKEKDWKKNQRKKNDEDSPSEMKKEMLRMQGLIICEGCQLAYSLYQPNCPNCGKSNQTHYPAKV